MGRYSLLLPAILFFVLAPVLLMVAPAMERTGRRLALLAAVVLLTFCAYGWAKTYAPDYEWLCVTHHYEACNNGDHPGRDARFGMWIVRHFG
jgi:hypothetical protein